MTRRQQTILGGVTVLGVTGIICKMVGVLYRIPLAWLIGDGGLGTYQLVFPTYSLLLTVSSAGLPVAISRMVSFCLARNDPANAKRVFRIALSFLAALGLCSTLLMIVLSGWLSARVGDPQTQVGFIAIAPALLLVCVMSAFRGLMQGQQDMRPTAISQLIEQVGKVFIALPLAWLGMRRGIGYAAAGALLGTSIAEAAALLYMLLLCRRRRAEFRAIQQDPDAQPMSRAALMKRLLSLAIPITLGACIVPLASFVDSSMLLNRMIDIGFELDAARSLYGLYSGLVITLINVPTAIAIAIAMSLVPAISSAMARHDMETVTRQSHLGLRYSFLIGLPCSVGMSLLAEPLLSFFYSSMGAESVRKAAELLRVSSLTIVLFTVVQSTSGILQGLRKQRIPMYTLMAGVAVKIVLNYTLVGTPEINIHGAPVSSLACYTISMIPNLYYVRKYGGVRFDWKNFVLRPGAATLLMGVCVFLLARLLPHGRLSTLVLLLTGVVSFGGFAWLFGAVTRDDLKPFLKPFFRRRKS